MFLPLSVDEASSTLMSAILTPERASAMSCRALSLSCLRRAASCSCTQHTQTHVSHFVGKLVKQVTKVNSEFGWLINVEKKQQPQSTDCTVLNAWVSQSIN